MVLEGCWIGEGDPAESAPRLGGLQTQPLRAALWLLLLLLLGCARACACEGMGSKLHWRLPMALGEAALAMGFEAGQVL